MGRGDKMEDHGVAEREMLSDVYNLIRDMEPDTHMETIEIYLWALAGLVMWRFVGY